MREPTAWKNLLQIEPAFLELEKSILSGLVQDYRLVPAEAFSWHAWDLIPEQRIFQLILPFLSQQLRRARDSMPGIYGRRLNEVGPDDIHSFDDWRRVPILVKDDDPDLGLTGFREAALRDPLILRPLDTGAAAVAFGSGGSSGRYTPTFVSRMDREREVQGWRRGHDYHGLVPGDRALYTYNTTHKGGQWMQESLWQHEVHVHLRRPEESPLQILDAIRAYHVNVVFTVQQPYAAMQHQAKAAGINLHSLVAASLENPSYRGLLVPDASGRRQVEFLFLGGFEIVPYAFEIIDEYIPGLPVATLLGSSEAIPQACSSNPLLTPTGLCHHNNLHLLQGPHYIEVVKPVDGAWLPVDKGESGLLVYTSLARDGTLWIRYAPGDIATLLLNEGECPCGQLSPVITGVQRKDPAARADLLLEGCASG